MEVTLPVYVQAVMFDSRQAYQCRPLFHAGPVMHHEHLRRAMELLGKRVKQELDELAGRDRQDALAAYHYYPAFEEKQLKLTLDMRDHLEKCRFLFVNMEVLGRHVAFTPSIPELWFDIDESKSLERRAEDVLTRHFRQQLKQDPAVKRPAQALSLEGDAWIEHLEVRVRTSPRKRREDPRRQSLWGDEEMDGWRELDRVGRCLDSLYPDDLSRASGREEVVKQLDEILRDHRRRPVLLVGRPLTGKTAVVHEVVRRRVQQRQLTDSPKRNVWLIAPQRLVSGMSYVGQWENRLLAILREAKKRNHVLYFDDLLGLYRAGISRDSSLCVADVLRNWVREREVRILGEITPEALHALSERDRALVDDFHVLRIDETSEAQTLRIAMGEIRQLEQRHECEFDVDVLPTAISLQRRFVSDACFPGKAAKFLKQLAVKHQRQRITRDIACREFHHQTGLSLDLLDDRRRLQRASVIEWMQQRIVGQAEALEATADVVSLAKARLNAPDRPLAAFVFLGPTGVGKTECAKTVAEYLFGSPSRLLRFDMNQFTSRTAVAQLTGTFDNPDGQLTSQVRHQPYSVLLLDEIEKADPDVLDLLLQILGEGRLTDALGRTTDFTNTIVIMTSNLGVRDSQHQVGFGGEERRRIFQRAAEQFFRPEFINRIDRVIPFARLSRAHIEAIAERLLGDVLGREGVVRRRCALHVDDQAMQSIVEAGYHPHLGARALKRSIECQLTTPLSHKLSALHPESPTLIQVFATDRGLEVAAGELVEAAPVPAPEYARHPSTEALDVLNEQVDRAEAGIRRLRPGSTLTAGQLTADQLRYFAAEEQVILVRELIDQWRDKLRTHRDRGPSSVGTTTPTHAMRRYNQHYHGRSDRVVMREISAANDIRDYFDEISERAARGRDDNETGFGELLGEAALLQAMAERIARHDGSAPQSTALDHAVVLIRPLRSHRSAAVKSMFAAWQRVYSDCFQLEVEGAPDASGRCHLMRLSGPFSRLLAEAETGVHLHCSRSGALEPIQACLLQTSDGGLSQTGDGLDLDLMVEHVRRLQDRWRQGIREGKPGPDPFPIGPIVRIYQEQGSVVDLRTQQTLSSWPEAVGAGHRRLVAGSFALPQRDAAEPRSRHQQSER